MSEFSKDEMTAAAAVLARLNLHARWIEALPVAAVLLSWIGQALSYASLTYPEDEQLRHAAAVYAAWRKLPAYAPVVDTIWAAEQLPPPPPAVDDGPTWADPTDEQLQQVVDHLRAMT
jgi:hypothetical protein